MSWMSAKGEASFQRVIETIKSHQERKRVYEASGFKSLYH